MTTFAKLLARKQQLVERLQQEDLGPHDVTKSSAS